MEHQIHADGFFHDRIGLAAVCGNHEILTLRIDPVAPAVCRIVPDAAGRGLHIPQCKWFAFLEVASGGAQFLLHAVVPIYSLVNLAGGVDGDMESFAQRANGANVVRVVVGDEHTHDVLKIQIHLLQPLGDGTCRDAGINQNALLPRSQVVAIAATTAGETPKYELIIFHRIL